MVWRLAVDPQLKMPQLSPSNSLISLMLAYRLAMLALHNLLYYVLLSLQRACCLVLRSLGSKRQLPHGVSNARWN